MFHNGYYLHPHYRQNQYPPVDIGYFQQSLTAYQTLLQDGSVIMNSLSSSPEMMKNLMEAAQEGKDEEVDSIIKATGVTSIVDTSFTPDSVTFTLYADAEEFSKCCTLKMNLKWG